MYYQLLERAQVFDPTQGMPEGKLAAFVSIVELPGLLEVLDLDPTILELVDAEALENTMTPWEDFSFGIVSTVDVGYVYRDRDLIGLLLTKDHFIVIDIEDKDASTRHHFRRALEQPLARNLSIPRLFNLFVKELIRGHAQVFMNYQRKIDEFDRSIWDTETEDRLFETELSDTNHQLLVLYGYYEQWVEICSELEENENEIFHDDQLGYIRSILNRMEHYSGNMRFLREYVAQVRESYQAQQDLKLNQVMKIFTVITTIFFPLTLLTGWYGMNFKNMPELNNSYSYVIIIIISILIIVFSIWYFKKKDIL